MDTGRMTNHLKPIPGHPLYQAGDDGRIYSNVGWRGQGLSPIKGFPTIHGYLRIFILDENRQRVRRSVHRLICEAFHGPPPLGRNCARHKNHIKTDNRPQNLEWGSYKENSQDMVRAGRAATGERNGDSRVSDAQYAEAKKLMASGWPIKAISEKYGVSKFTAYRWKNAREGLRT